MSNFICIKKVLESHLQPLDSVCVGKTLTIGLGGATSINRGIVLEFV